MYFVTMSVNSMLASIKNNNQEDNAKNSINYLIIDMERATDLLRNLVILTDKRMVPATWIQRRLVTGKTWTQILLLSQTGGFFRFRKKYDLIMCCFCFLNNCDHEKGNFYLDSRYNKNKNQSKIVLCQLNPLIL